MARAEERARPGAPLARRFETSELVRVVPHLPAETLHQLIRYRGLDASGDLLAAASREQLSLVLDLDLWRPAAAAGDERFDLDRFAEWLETLVDTGEPVAARIVAGLDERLVAAGLSVYIRVFDPAARAAGWSTDDEAPETSLRDVDLAVEVGGYLVAARRTDAWDAIVSVLAALEDNHRDYFHAVMRPCRRLSNSRPEEDGLDDLLHEPDQMLHDLAVARESRRTEQGYLAPAQARGWLQMARQRPLPGPRARPSVLHDMAAEYLRDDGEAATTPGGAEAPAGGGSVGSPPAGIEESVQAVVDLLSEAGVVPGRPRALLQGATGQPSPVERLRAFLAHLADTDQRAHLARSRELAFLANVLMAGCSVDARPFTVQEAADAAAATCNLGLEQWHEDVPDLLAVFQAGWAALHEMGARTARRLVTILGDLRTIDVETQGGLDALRQELARHGAAGAPWRARDALDVIAVLDMPAWVSLLGVLGECPMLPEALSATVERRTGRIDATAFDFISTNSQIENVTVFTDRLVDILVGR